MRGGVPSYLLHPHARPKARKRKLCSKYLYLDVIWQPNHVLFAGVLIWTWIDWNVKPPHHKGYKDTRQCTYFNLSRCFTSSRKKRCDQVCKDNLFVGQADRSLDQSTLGNFMTGLYDFWLIQISNSNVHLIKTVVWEKNIQASIHHLRNDWHGRLRKIPL